MPDGYELASSGLLLPEGTEEAAVRDLLQKHDRNLRLTKQIDMTWGRWVYMVSVQVSPDRVERLLSWRDENGCPLPLSSAIVDRAQMLDRNTVGGPENEDEANRALLERRRRESREWGEEIASEFGKRIDGRFSSPLPRSQSLRMARDKQRARQATNELRP